MANTKLVENKVENEEKICRICQISPSVPGSPELSKAPPAQSSSWNKNSSEVVLNVNLEHAHAKMKPEDNLMSPCLCSGSVKYVHHTCLQKWVAVSGATRCELCHYEFKVEHRIKPLREWKFLPMSPHQAVYFAYISLFQIMAVCLIIREVVTMPSRNASPPGEDDFLNLVDNPEQFEQSNELSKGEYVLEKLSYLIVSVIMGLITRAHIMLLIRWIYFNRFVAVVEPVDNQAINA